MERGVCQPEGVSSRFQFMLRVDNGCVRPWWPTGMIILMIMQTTRIPARSAKLTTRAKGTTKSGGKGREEKPEMKKKKGKEKTEDEDEKKKNRK